MKFFAPKELAYVLVPSDNPELDKVDSIISKL